ncbi:MAG TPA: 2-hydroxyacyl-CoA dehydratase family protein [Candidatus Brocadiia bacterium]|nr:2-hydroxyacyl-CoA dehydratase family protein [Candidatus Brocadiia bacterium]
MDRKAYIAEQKEKRGRKTVLVFPIHYPREVLTALNVLGVEIWGPPGFPRAPASTHLQPFICGIAHNILAFIMAGKADVVDGILCPHTCDSLQMLASLLPDFKLTDKPCFRFRHPKGKSPDSKSARGFYKAELKGLLDKLEPFFGRPSEAELQKAIGLHLEADELKLKLLDQRAYFTTNDRAFYEVLRAGEYLWVEDHIAMMKKLLESKSPEPVEKRKPIMVSGIVPEPMDILDAINNAGAFAAADDFAAISRRIAMKRPNPDSDPLDALTDMFFARRGCTTLGTELEERANLLLKLAKSRDCRGLLIYNVKFCEPEAFYVPDTQDIFKKAGIPSLYMETELEAEFSGQASTRLEAFIEMLEQPS